VLPKLLFTIRTADRSPKKNYLWATMESLLRGGVSPDQIHVFPTDSDVAWMPYLPCVHVYVPEARRTANMNGIAPIALLDSMDADWIILSEDDLEWCDNPIETKAQWLQDHARSDVSVYRFFAFERQMVRSGLHATETPLREQKGSQVIALRAEDAKRFAQWAKDHPSDWRPAGAPFQDQPHNGFDKLVGYWALQDNPSVRVGLVSRPFFVRHMGLESSLHKFGVTRHESFDPRPYEVAACP